MNNTSKMARLLSSFRMEMNGAVSDSMKRGGLAYPLNYGVSIPTVRKLAREYAPDHSFALFLYKQQVRELKLASFVIASPEMVDEQELSIWAGGVDNPELAENLATSLLSRTTIVDRVVDEWLLRGGDTLLKYAAMITLAKAIDRGTYTPDQSELSELVREYSRSDEPLLRRGAELIEIRM